jgi:hypothetical protein
MVSTEQVCFMPKFGLRSSNMLVALSLPVIPLFGTAEVPTPAFNAA